MLRATRRTFSFFLFVFFVAVVTPQAQKSTAPKITTPKEQFGWDIGDDYRLVNYTQYVEYLKKLDQAVRAHDRARDRQDGGGTSRADRDHHVAGEPQKLRADQGGEPQLALAEGLTDDQARQLAHEDGKTVVWIDGGLHATEVLGAQQLIETIYR